MAARAIEEELTDRLPHCDVLVEDVYQWLPWYRRWLYTVGWRFANTVFWEVYSRLWKKSVSQLPAAERERPLYRRIFPRVESSLIAYDTDVIISTHPVGSELGVLAKQHGLVSRVISVVTDYHSHAFTHVPGVDVVCIPDEHIIRMVSTPLLDHSSPQEVVTGIPVRKSFEQALALAHRPNHPVVVFSKGGDTFHLSSIRRIAYQFRKYPWTLRFVNVRGVAAPRVLSHTGALRVEVYPYWKAFASLLAEASVFVAKPGGLTIAEATSLGIPLIAIAPHPGQEENNIRFVIDRGIGIEANSLGEIEEAIVRILNDHSYAQRAHALGRPAASRALIDVVLSFFPRKGITPVYPEGEKTTTVEHESES